MKLQRGCDVSPDGRGVVCRQSRLGAVLLVALFGVLLASMPLGLWWIRGPWFLIALGGLFAVAILSLLVGDLRARFRPTNWVLWIGSDRIWINLRSYQDQGPLDEPSVVELLDEEIAQLRRQVQHYSVPDSHGGSVHQKLASLEFVLKVPDDGQIIAALAAGRRRRQPERTHLGLIRSTSGVTLYSVSQPCPAVIRIAWFGGQGHGVRPGLRHVLALLAQRFPQGDAPTTHQKDWQALNDAELDEQILQLACAGDRMAAIKLLVNRRGYSTTQAKQFVDGLIDRA